MLCGAPSGQRAGHTSTSMASLRITAGSAYSAFCGAPQNAEFEREILRERVKAGIAQAKHEVRLMADHRPSKHAVPKLNASSLEDSVNARSPNG